MGYTNKHMHTTKQRRLLYGGLVIIVLFLGGWLVRNQLQPDSSPSVAQPAKTNPKPATQTFDKTTYSNDQPTSPWLITNKRRPLSPVDYTPPLAAPAVTLRLPASNPEMQVSQQIVGAVQGLFAAAKQDGIELMVASGFRSYSQQVAVYNAEVGRNGRDKADRESARPGHSEHQTGLALDVEPVTRQCEVEVCFGDLPEGKWVAANAHNHGFIIRYMPGTEAITGYTYEPWHLRYVGKELAAEVYRLGNPPLEIFFELGAAPDYQ